MTCDQWKPITSSDENDSKGHVLGYNRAAVEPKLLRKSGVQLLNII